MIDDSINNDEYFAESNDDKHYEDAKEVSPNKAEKTTIDSNEQKAKQKTQLTILDIFKKHSIEVESNLEILHENLLFLENAINLVIGESKSGKTYTTIKSLVDVGLLKRIIHLDFDRNADKKLEELKVETYHIGNAVDFLTALGDAKPNSIIDSLKGKILVIDSLQDLASEDGYDSNHAALKTMKIVAGFKDTGATLIVIHHTTLENGKTFKVKGNATTITSKCDTTLTFERKDNKRTITVMNTRAEDKIPSGKSVIYGSDSSSKSSKGGSSEVPK